jgi:hypothetical protein
VRIRHFFVQDAVANKEIDVKGITSELQAADLLTKLIEGNDFKTKSRLLRVHDKGGM